MNKINIRLRKFVAFAAVGATVLFSSCLKSDHYDYVIQVAGLAFINASPGSPDLDLVADNVRETLPGVFSYDSSYGYLRAYPGYRVFGFTKKHTNNLITSQQFYLQPGEAYSIFIADTLGSAKLFCFKDSLNIPDTTKYANIRFINLSPDSKSLNLMSGTDTLFSNIAFGKATDFMAVNPDTYSLKTGETGSSATLSTLTNVTFKKGGIYTVWARGYEKTAVDSIKIGLQQVQNNESAEADWEQ